MGSPKEDFDGWLAETAEKIVSAGLDPSQWASIPDAFAGRFPGSKVVFYAQDLAAGFVGSHHANIEPSFIDDYQSYYCQINPWSPFVARSPARAVLVSDDDMPASSFAKTEFYADWLLKFGTSSTAIKPVDDDAGRFTCLTLHYEKSLAPKYNRATARALRILEPTFHAALSLNREIVRAKTNEATIGALLKALPIPALILDRRGVVRFANVQALMALEAKSLIRDDGKGRLVLADRVADGTLKEGLMRLCGNDETAAGDIPLRNANGVAGIVSLFAISGTAPDLSGLTWLYQPERLALVLLRDPTTLTEIPVERLRTNFGLTKAEARLAARLATGESLDSAAEALGITRLTARTQLKTVFAKTNTHRQSELVALLARL